MNKILLTLFLITSVFISINKLDAQNYLGMQQSNYSGILGAQIQPASIADNRLVFDMTLIGLNTTFYQNYRYFDAKQAPHKWWVKTFNPEKGGQPTSDWLGQSNFLDNNFIPIDGKKNYQSYLNTQVDIFSFMFNVKNMAFGLSYKIRAYNNITRVSPELVNLVSSDFTDSTLWNLDLSDNFLNVTANAWHEYSFHYAQVVMDKEEHFIKVGGAAKLLQGIGSAYVYSSDVGYEFNSQDTAVYIQGDLAYGYAESVQNIIDNPSGDGGGFSDMMKNYYPMNNWGFGLDLGVVYEWRPDWKEYKYDMDGKTNLWRKDKNKYKLKAGFSILDIGGISYKKSGVFRNINIDTNFLDVRQAFDDVNDFESFDSVMLADFNQTDNGKNKFWVDQPVSISVQVDYNIWNDFYVNFTAQWGLSLKKNSEKAVQWSNYSITPRYDYKWFGFSLPMSINSYSGFKAGVGLRMGPFIVGVTDFRSLFMTGKVRGADVYAAVKIPVLYTHPKDRDLDKVSDKLDLCIDVPGVWHFQGCPDTDGDSIQDSMDDCPNDPGLAEFNGCPDRDGDKIIDSKDICPDEAGLVEFDGCPDRDGDKIIDSKDDCPDIAGLEIFNGCPDSDEDGIKDSDDLCPNDPGPKENQGCPDTDKDGTFDYLDDCVDVPGPADNNGCPWPDTDGDGMLDKDDKCPYNAGPPENDGCPYTDTDGDGVIDKDDECVNTPGLPENKGCPEINKEEEEILNTAFENLEFESGKAIIKEVSFPSLEELAELLVKKAEWRIKIAGHTDNVGNDRGNLILSKKRAEAVRTFIEQRGVSVDRVVVQFFGETKPIASNDTKEGRQKNRRVEMEIIFE